MSTLVVLVLLAGAAVWVLRDRLLPDAAESEASAEPVPVCSEQPLAGEIPDRYWGLHSPTPIGAEFPDAPLTAVNLTTAQVYWNQIELAPGEYDFTRLDQILATSQERGAQPMLVLGFTPSFHAADPASPTARATMPDLDAWRAWVSAVVERYGSRIDYQIWPEPNIVSNWEGTPEQMAQLSVVAGDLIHEQAPDATVVSPAAALRLPSQQRWLDEFWATGVDGRTAADALDAVALDPFPVEDGTPEDTVDLLCAAHQILVDNGVDLPIWTNEINYGVPSGGNASDAEEYSDERQAAVVARTYVLHAAVGVQRVYWLGWFEYPGMAVDMSRDGATTPAGEAFVRVHDWMAGGSAPTCRVEDGTHRCEVQRGGATTTILWREEGEATVVAPGRAELQTLSGESRQLATGDSVEVGQSPVAMVGAD